MTLIRTDDHRHSPYRRRMAGVRLHLRHSPLPWDGLPAWGVVLMAPLWALLGGFLVLLTMWHRDH